MNLKPTAIMTKKNVLVVTGSEILFQQVKYLEKHTFAKKYIWSFKAVTAYNVFCKRIDLTQPRLICQDKSGISPCLTFLTKSGMEKKKALVLVLSPRTCCQYK